jgi:DNA-directed RNA polymerase specialized sigma subunit
MPAVKRTSTEIMTNRPKPAAKNFIRYSWYNKVMSLKDPKNQKMLNDFMAEHAPLIHKQVNVLKSKGRIPPNVEVEDLHFAGFHGLMDALHKYDHDVAGRLTKKGENPFVKYAERRIQGKMLDHIAAQDPLPKTARIKAKNLAGKPDEEG